MADLGGVARLDSSNCYSFSLSFIGNKVLQLIETPIAEPVVHSPASSQLSYSSKIFHYNHVSIKVGNNVLADIVVIPSHETSFSSSELLKKPSAGTSAFSLKFATQVFESSFNLLDFSRIIEPAIRSDSKIIYAEVNAKSTILQNKVISNDVFGECENEEASAFSIYLKQAFFDIPSEIFFIAVRNIEFEFLSFVEQPQDKNITFEIGTSWEVVSDRSAIDDRLTFGFLDHPAGLLDAGNCQLCWQSPLAQKSVDKWMEFDIVPNLTFPSLINAELQSIAVNLDCSYYLWCNRNLDFGCCSLHDYNKAFKVFKITGGRQFIPTLRTEYPCLICDEPSMG